MDKQIIPTGGEPAAIGGEISGAKFPPQISCSTGPNRHSPNCSYCQGFLVSKLQLLLPQRLQKGRDKGERS
uniref:Uncharacterized protein n=1 Tax=Arundo donax TaxID=35708 RepID=A0A0A9B6U5_ARUDO